MSGTEMIGWVMTAGLRLVGAAAPSPSGTPRYEDDAVARPGWLGFAVFLAMLAAAYLLFRSMQRHLKKVDFDEAPRDEPPAPPGAPGA